MQIGYHKMVKQNQCRPAELSHIERSPPIVSFNDGVPEDMQRVRKHPGDRRVAIDDKSGPSVIDVTRLHSNQRAT